MVVAGSSLAAIVLAVILAVLFATRRNKNVSVASASEQKTSEAATPASFSPPKGLPGKQVWKSFSNSAFPKTLNRKVKRKNAAKKRTAR